MWISATLGALAMGTILAWSSAAQTLLPGVAPFEITKEDGFTYSSVFGIGAIFGALPSGKLTNLIGYRFAMIIYELCILAGWVLLTIPKALWMLIAGRIVQGIGVGALCTTIPAYVGEIAEPRIRGTTR